KKMLLRWRNWIIFLVHSGAVGAALLAAWLLRFDFTLPHLRLLLTAMAVLIAIRLGALYCYKLNHGYWRHTGIGDLKDLTKATLLGSSVFFVLVRWIAGVRSFPYSIYILEGMLAFLFLAGLRVSVRMFFRARRMRNGLARMPVLIVGAGAAAALLIRELERTNYSAIGLVDDDPKKLGTKLC